MYCASFRAYISGYTRNIRIIIACMCLPCSKPIIVSPLYLLNRCYNLFKIQFECLMIQRYTYPYSLIFLSVHFMDSPCMCTHNNNKCINHLGVLHPLAINWRQSLPMLADRWSASIRKTLNSSDTSTVPCHGGATRRCNADDESSHDRIRGKSFGWFSRVVV